MPAADPVDVILRLQGLRAFLAGTREASVGIREMGVAAGQANAAAASGAASTGKLAGAMGLVRKAGKWGALALVGMGVESVHMAANFDQAMTMVHTQAGASAEEVQRLRGQVLDLAEVSPQGPEELAKGLYHLESIGLRGAKAMYALKVAAQGAAVGQADLEDTASALGAAWLTDIKGAGNLHQVMATLNATVGAGNMRMGELVRALGTGVLPSAKVAGLGIKDVMGALAILTDEGYQGSSAMAQLATAFHFLYAPTEKAKGALEQIGLSQFKLAQDMRTKGLPAALQDLRTHLDAFSKDKNKQAEILSSIVPGGRGRVLLVLMNQLDRYKQKIDQITRTSKNFDSAVDTQRKTTVNQLRTAWSTMQVAFVKLGTELAPVAIKLVKIFTAIAAGAADIVRAFMHLPKTQRTIIGVAGALAILALAGGPVALAIGVIAGGAYLIVKNWKPISRFFQGLWHDVSTWAVNAWHLIMRETEPVRHLISTVFQKALAGVRPIFRMLASGWGLVATVASHAFRAMVVIVRMAVGPILQILKGLWMGIKGVVNIIGGILTGDFGRVWRGVKQIFKGGVNVIVGALRLATVPIRAVVSHIGGVLTGLWKILKKIAEFMVSGFKVAFSVVIAPLKTFIGVVRSVIGIVGGVIGKLKDAAGGVGDFVKSTIGFVTGQHRVDNLRHSMDLLRGAVESVGSAAITSAQRLAGIKTAGDLTGRGKAWGGLVKPGATRTWVGERGPELVDLPAGARVHANHSEVVKSAALATTGVGDFDLPDVIVPVSIDGRTVAKAVGKFVSNKKARK